MISNSNWLVAYTLPQREKKANIALSKIGYNTYLPLRKVVRQWSDRKKQLEVPLFPSYLFIQNDAIKIDTILRLREIANLVRYNNRYATLSDAEVNMLKQVSDQPDISYGSEYYFEKGATITIKEGPFKGMNGTIVRKNGKSRLVVQLDAIQQGISLNVPSHMLGSPLCLDIRGLRY